MCPSCHGDQITEYSYDGGTTVMGYECRDCETTWSP